jgi:hypothetical protein
MELKAYQFAFYHDKDNLQHLALDKQLRQKLFNLKSAERLFFAQKLKCNFFKDYDKGSSLFFSHASVTSKELYLCCSSQ